MDRDSLHFLNDLLFCVTESFLKREKDMVLLNHRIIIPEISSEQYAAHEPLKKDHSGSWDVFSVKKVKDNFKLFFA